MRETSRPDQRPPPQADRDRGGNPGHNDRRGDRGDRGMQ
jgi:hypothetical protein